MPSFQEHCEESERLFRQPLPQAHKLANQRRRNGGRESNPGLRPAAMNEQENFDDNLDPELGVGVHDLFDPPLGVELPEAGEPVRPRGRDFQAE